MAGSKVTLGEKAAKLIEGKNFGFLATLMKDGSPQVSPVWVDRDGDVILVNTAMGRLKQKNAKRDARVAIAIADASNPYSMIAVRGTVLEQTTRGAEEHADKLAKKYIGKDKYPKTSPTERRVILRIRPEKIAMM